MATPNTKNGITKDSTLLINVNPYLPNNYKQTLNYVGYWKWDSTNQTFIQVLNNQDIIDENYNLKIQPLFYDADTGLPQKVTVNSGDTKRLKMVNDNNDGSMEPTEYVEPNLMVKFNSKTRSITEYPYFEVEALPPTITSPITSNGYYKFDGNTLIPGTDQDYNIYINVIPITIINNWEDLINTFGNMSVTGKYNYYIGVETRPGTCSYYSTVYRSGTVYLNDQNWRLATSNYSRNCGYEKFINIKYDSNNEYWIISVKTGYSNGDHYIDAPSASSSGVGNTTLIIEYNGINYDNSGGDIYLKFYSSGTIEKIN